VLLWNAGHYRPAFLFALKLMSQKAYDYTEYCVEDCVATNLDINPRLIEEAQQIGKHKSKKDAVTKALEEYIRTRKQMRIFELAGQIDFDPTYDYKKERRRR